MKKNKTIYLGLTLFIVIALLTMSFTSCNNDISEFQRVIMLGQPDGDIFDSSIMSIDIVETEYQDEGADTTRNIVLANGDSEVVRYVQSKKSELTDIAIYSSDSKDISCYYDSKSDLLSQIYAKNNTILVPTNITTEADYRDWVENLLTIYGAHNLSSYRYSCQTNVIVSNEESTYQDQYTYFYTDIKTNERISKYVFTYTKYIDDYPTTDTVTVSISALTGSVIIKFDKGDFTDVADVTIDNSTIKTAIDSYIADSINTNKYEFVSTQITEKTLTRIESEVCVRVEVEISLLTKSDQVPLNVLVSLLVYSE